MTKNFQINFLGMYITKLMIEDGLTVNLLVPESVPEEHLDSMKNDLGKSFAIKAPGGIDSEIDPLLFASGDYRVDCSVMEQLDAVGFRFSVELEKEELFTDYVSKASELVDVANEPNGWSLTGLSIEEYSQACEAMMKNGVTEINAIPGIKPEFHDLVDALEVVRKECLKHQLPCFVSVCQFCDGEGEGMVEFSYNFPGQGRTSTRIKEIVDGSRRNKVEELMNALFQG